MQTIHEFRSISRIQTKKLELVESNEEEISQQCESENDGKAKKQKCELVNNILEEDDSDDDWPLKWTPKNLPGGQCMFNFQEKERNSLKSCLKGGLA